MSKQTGIGIFFRPVTLSNEKNAPNAINKNVTPQNTDVLQQQNLLHTLLRHYC